MRLTRALIILISITMAALGGVVAYRAAFVEPSTAIVITEESIREVPSTPRIIGGIGLLLVGAAIAFFAARRR